MSNFFASGIHPHQVISNIIEELSRFFSLPRVSQADFLGVGGSKDPLLAVKH